MLVPVALGVSFLVFLILHLTPGNPALLLAGSDAPPETIAAIERQLGLDQPVLIQYARYLTRALQGDLGRSLGSRRPVSWEIARTFPRTLELTGAGIAVAIAVGIPLGVVAAVRQRSVIDTASMFLALAGLAMPVFAVGILLMWTFGYWLGWLPISGRGGGLWTLNGLRHLVLPAVTLSTFSLAIFARMTRSSLLEVLRQDYIRTARAKGLSERVVIYRHALKNAFLPVITVVGTQFGFLLGGAVVTETVFAWPGVGRLSVQAILARDFPLVQGIVLVLAVSFVLVNLLVDLLYAVIDPRIRYE